MSRLSKNIIYNLIGQGLLLVLGFVSIKYIFKQLGEDALGIIYFSTMMNALLCAVLEMGICSTTVREVSAHFKSEPDYIRDLIRTASVFYWGAYALLGLAIYFLAPVLVEKWINLKTMDSETAIYILRILGIASLVALPRSFYASLFRGLQRMEFNNFIDVVTIGLQQFGTVLILAFGGNLFHVVYWFASCYALRILIYLAVSVRFFSLKAIIPGFSSVVVKRNFGFASRMMFISIVSVIRTQADKLIISKLMPVGVLGFYSVAYGTASKGALLTGAVSQAAYPSLSELFRKGDRSKLISQYRKLQDLLCFGIVPLFAAIPFALLPLFSYILNADIATLLLVPTTLLCVGFFMNGTVNVPYVLSLAVGKPGIIARQNFYGLFVTLPVTALLIYFWGLTGAGLSWVFYHIFTYSYGVPRICRECIEIPVWQWYRHVLKIFVLTGLTYGLAWIALDFVSAHTIINLAIAYLIATILFLIGAFLLIGDELREVIVKYLKIIRSFRFLEGSTEK
ncbi:MAG: oligosaccharide flippase family protein [Nitrospirota bacterium]|nr:oligosaccharide flippase family protein [Nitrospirota bacterium]